MGGGGGTHNPLYVADQSLLSKVPPPVEAVVDIGRVFEEEYDEGRRALGLRPDRFPELSWTTDAVAGRPTEGEWPKPDWFCTIISEQCKADRDNSSVEDEGERDRACPLARSDANSYRSHRDH